MENLPEEVPCNLLVMARKKSGFLNRFFHGCFTKKMAYTTITFVDSPKNKWYFYAGN